MFFTSLLQLAREEAGKANAEKRGSSGSPVKDIDGKSSGGRNGYVILKGDLTTSNEMEPCD